MSMRSRLPSVCSCSPDPGRGLAATEDALELKPYAESLAATAAALLRAASVQGEAVAGTVRVSASEAIGDFVWAATSPGAGRLSAQEAQFVASGERQRRGPPGIG
jgi:DNA-binding transcriptional LysR family regulator